MNDDNDDFNLRTNVDRIMSRFVVALVILILIKIATWG